jgi:hypothetical protein
VKGNLDKSWNDGQMYGFRVREIMLSSSSLVHAI